MKLERIGKKTEVKNDAHVFALPNTIHWEIREEVVLGDREGAQFLLCCIWTMDTLKSWKCLHQGSWWAAEKKP